MDGHLFIYLFVLREKKNIVMMWLKWDGKVLNEIHFESERREEKDLCIQACDHNAHILSHLHTQNENWYLRFGFFFFFRYLHISGVFLSVIWDICTDHWFLPFSTGFINHWLVFAMSYIALAKLQNGFVDFIVFCFSALDKLNGMVRKVFID